AEPDAVLLKDIDRVVEQWRLDSRVPGLVYGVVKDGRLIVVKGQGVQDTLAQAARQRRLAVSHRLDEQGVHGPGDPQAAR
ncbi:hypothetical protein, partial [Caulobacter sp. B11]|uniref:hypothetical protein n=1 Tax=Caulobacter sp. B11 TaxID=2048899 RepID=UPI001374825A